MQNFDSFLGVRKASEFAYKFVVHHTCSQKTKQTKNQNNRKQNDVLHAVQNPARVKSLAVKISLNLSHV